MEVQKCQHGQHKNLKLCISSECKLSALMSMSCEKCLQNHEHQGLTTTRRLDAIETHIKNLSGKDEVNSPATEQLAEKSVRMIQEVNRLAQRLEKDRLEMSKRLVVKPDVGILIQRLQGEDPGLRGADIEKLTRQIKGTQIYTNKPVVEGTIKELEDAYLEFLESATDIVEKARQKRKPLLKTLNLTSEKKGQPAASVKKQNGDLKKASQGYEWRGGQQVKVSREQKQVSKESPSAYTYIKDIQPGMENLNVVAKVLRTQLKPIPGIVFAKCLLGDETGVIQGSFANGDGIEQGAVLSFEKIKSLIVKQTGRLCLNSTPTSVIRQSDVAINDINKGTNVSKKNWYADDGDE